MKNKIRYFLFLCMLLPGIVRAAGLSNGDRTRINQALSRMIDREVMGGQTKIDRVQIKGRRLRLYCSIGLANYPFREESVEAIYDTVRSLLPASLAKHRLEIYTDGNPIEALIPLACRTKFDRRKVIPFTNRSSHPLVQNTDRAVTPTRGLQERHIALWQSHGRYFDQTQNRWRWQRTAQWQTREDLFTQSFVLPYLVPMLEQAGANVLLPRERDLQTIELIIDGDTPLQSAGYYCEITGEQAWEDAGEGFAARRTTYSDGENPFREGRCRVVKCVTHGKESRAEWHAHFPKSDEYALYVSYKSFPNSCREAAYTVYHAGGESHFRVNQRMGGGTWIYLGTFRFEAGATGAVVSLSNSSKERGEVVSADAVKIGGGYGNIARTVCDSLRQEGVDYYAETSGFPRSCEGARYWLQWAGFDEEVYAPRGGGDDYKEDYMCRAHWVNALMGGSERLPETAGMGIPIDLALAFHSDSGVRDNDETIGTLGIFFTGDNKGLFEGGSSRYRSRDLTDLVMSEIVKEIRSQWEPTWRRRGLWNRSYYEARVPAAPTMLLELLSHQNFADMRYGHDPRFKFAVARAIYKGILKHIAAQYNYPFVVQPLPVERFSCQLSGPEEVELRWQPRLDASEPTAQPKGYVLYTAVDDGDFDHGTRVKGNSVRLTQEPGRRYRYRVTAWNEGGESFPSETLAACHVPEEQGRVLIVNGFTRVSAAPGFRNESEAGFCSDYDGSVAYLRDIAYIGAQRVFDRSRYDERDEELALGSCQTDFEGEWVAGNTFDYPSLHGQSIARAGYSYASCSLKALLTGEVATEGYPIVDLILGKQRSTLIGSGATGYAFKSFPEPLQEFLQAYTARGGSLLVSGSYLGSDLWESENSCDRDRRFAREVLRYEHAGSQAARKGKVRGTSALLPPGGCRFNQSLCKEFYAVESPDALAPVNGSFAVARYAENDRVAAVACRLGGYRSVAMGFPLEAVTVAEERDLLMKGILNFLSDNKIPTDSKNTNGL